MANINFEPPQTITINKTIYKYIETKTENSKGEKLSEDCYWYEVGGKREPMSRGNIESLIKKI
jgi:hypothetical protein